MAADANLAIAVTYAIEDSIRARHPTIRQIFIEARRPRPDIGHP